MNDGATPIRVAYLIGAGASHACAKRVGSPHGLLMRDLGPSLSARVHALAARDPSLSGLVNTVVDETTDFEHVISFLDSAPSALHRRFADDLRSVFEGVLRERLQAVSDDAAGNPIGLYTVLFDIYNLPSPPELLRGILTTNYDPYIEEALEAAGRGPVDFGFELDEMLGDPASQGTTLLKLHGSFDWQDTWPISRGSGDHTLWIPPGINKDKQTYPFNVLWGLARELLSCDVLRVIGCRLDANDWDLVSLLFTSIHVHSRYRPYTVEVIDAPRQVRRLRELFPYLRARSILDLDDVGPQLIQDLCGADPEEFWDLTESERSEIIDNIAPNHNWFDIWLRQKVEHIYIEQGPLETPIGALDRYLEQ